MKGVANWKDCRDLGWGDLVPRFDTSAPVQDVDLITHDYDPKTHSYVPSALPLPRPPQEVYGELGFDVIDEAEYNRAMATQPSPTPLQAVDKREHDADEEQEEGGSNDSEAPPPRPRSRGRGSSRPRGLRT